LHAKGLMKRFQAFEEDSGDGGIDISPLIDCVFILLIFFIVTTTFVEETGIEVDKPQAASSANLEKNSILLAITDKGAVVYGGREIGISGVQPLVKRMIQKEDIPVIIQADMASQSGLLVRIIDEAKLAGACLQNETAYNTAFNAAGDEFVSYEYWVEALREATGKAFDVERIDPFDDSRAAKLPFPFEKIVRFNTKQVQTATIGYDGDRTIRNLFWSTAHFQKAYNFVLGEGKELITVNVDIHYLIDDIFVFHYRHKDPESELKNIGYETFTSETVHRNIE